MRQRIVTATLTCIRRVGLSDLSLGDICQAAEISNGALYTHFRSKREMLLAAVERLTGESLAYIDFHDAYSLRAFWDKMEKETRRHVEPRANLDQDFAAAARSDEALAAALRRAANARYVRFKECVQRLQDGGCLQPHVEVGAATDLMFLVGNGLVLNSHGSMETPESRNAALKLLLDNILVGSPGSEAQG